MNQERSYIHVAELKVAAFSCQVNDLVVLIWPYKFFNALRSDRRSELNTARVINTPSEILVSFSTADSLWQTMSLPYVALASLLPIVSAPPSGTFPVSWWRQGSGQSHHFVQAWLLQLATYWRRQLPASSITVAPECGRPSCYQCSSTWTHHANTQAT